MVGFSSTDQYDNATLDNFAMMLGGSLGFRIGSASIDHTTDGIVVTQMSGDISAYVNNTSTGLYTITFENDYTIIPGVLANMWDTNRDHQAHVYEVTRTGCKVMIGYYNGVAWALLNRSFDLIVIGR